MDHSWGRNVRRYGLGSFNVTLCSRLLPFPPDYVLINVTQEPDACVYMRVPSDMNPDAPYTIGVLPRFEEHFPYGWPVDPDVPL